MPHSSPIFLAIDVDARCHITYQEQRIPQLHSGCSEWSFNGSASKSALYTIHWTYETLAKGKRKGLIRNCYKLIDFSATKQWVN